MRRSLFILAVFSALVIGSLQFQAATAGDGESYCPPGAKFCPAPGSTMAYADEGSFGHGSYAEIAGSSEATDSYFESQLNEGERLIMVAPGGYAMEASETASSPMGSGMTPALSAPVGSYSMPSSSFASSYSDSSSNNYSNTAPAPSLGGMGFMPPPPGGGSSPSVIAYSEPIAAPAAPVARSVPSTPSTRTLFQDSYDDDSRVEEYKTPEPAMASVSGETSRTRSASRQAAQTSRSAIASRASTNTRTPPKAKVYTVIEDDDDDSEDYGDLPGALSGRDFQSDRSDRETFSDRGSFKEEKEKVIHPYQNKPAKQKVRKIDMLSEVANETSKRTDKGIDLKPRPENRVPWWKGGVWRNRGKSHTEDAAPMKTRADIKAEREAAKKAAKEAKRNGEY